MKGADLHHGYIEEIAPKRGGFVLKFHCFASILAIRKRHHECDARACFMVLSGKLFDVDQEVILALKNKQSWEIRHLQPRKLSIWAIDIDRAMLYKFQKYS